ncbi:MAG: ArsR/SmtB family transcription factor [Gammaproteobacteria bacterium]
MTMHAIIPFEMCADKLKVLADPTRLHVVRELMSGPKSVGELNEQVAIEQSLLSHHLKVLRAAGVVQTQRAGKSVRYSLAPEVAAAPDGALNLGCCRLDFTAVRTSRRRRVSD